MKKLKTPYIVSVDLVKKIPIISHMQNGVIVHEADGQWARLLYEEAKNPLILKETIAYYNFYR